MSLECLIDDAVLLIADHVPSERDINSLSRTCRRFHELLDQYLYQRHVRGRSGKALRWAAIKDLVPTANKLFSVGEKLCHGQPRELSPLVYAALHGGVNMTRLLLDLHTHSEHPDHHADRGYKALDAAAKCGHAETLELLLGDPRVDPGSQEHGMTALYTAISHKHVKVVEALLRDARVDTNSIDVDSWEIPPLFCAVMGEKLNTEVIKVLLDSPRVDNFLASPLIGTALHAAAGHGHHSNISLLLQRGLDPNARNDHGEPPLAVAASEGRSKVVRQLISVPGIDPNAQDSSGDSPLHHAVKVANQPKATIHLLLGHERIQPNLRDRNGLTPFMHALRWSRLDALRAILGCDKFSMADALPLTPGEAFAGADELWTPLMYAAAMGITDVVRILCEDGRMVPDAQDRRGRNAMHLAVSNGSADVAALLLKVEGKLCTLSWNQPDRGGATPLMLAERKCNAAIIELLRSKRFAFSALSDITCE